MCPLAPSRWLFLLGLVVATLALGCGGVHPSPQEAAAEVQAIVKSQPSIALDEYGGLANLHSPNRPTSMFRAEKFGNKWMLVDPDNNAFFLIGMYALDQDGSSDDRGSSYYQRTGLKYGNSGPPWGTAQVGRVRSWGFNAAETYASAYVLPVTSDLEWPKDHTNPEKMPFVGMVRAAFYAMLNRDQHAPAPIKNLMYGTSRYYNENYGFRTGNGVGDYFDPNLEIYLGNLLKDDENYKAIKKSPYKRYLIGMNSDDSDQIYGFAAGPDFPTSPDTGHNNSHLGWVVLTMSPLQSANPDKGFVYQDRTVFSKKALRDQLAAQYGTISALNAAWNSSYSTFDSSGVSVTGEHLGTGNGSTLTFTKTLDHPSVSQMSLQILVNSQPAAGDVGPNAAGKIWGPQVNGTVDYSTGQVSITFAPGHAPAAGAALTASYVQNGWGIGSGLMDEDGRPAHHSWVGTDFTFLKDVNPNLRADLDRFLYQVAAQYFSVCRRQIEAWMPGVLYLGTDSLGTWGVPSNRQVLKAASQYVDVMVTSEAVPMSQPMLDFIYTYFGDKPLLVGEFRTANADSAFHRFRASVPQSDFPTQQARGKAYYTSVTAYPALAYSNGSRPYIGIAWWQYLDNWGEKNAWGLVSLSDNAYDGHEAVRAAVPCSPPLSSYRCGGEDRDYGDALSYIKAANQQVKVLLQNGANTGR